MKKILCIGGVTADIMVKPVNQLPLPGTLEAVDDICMFVGGCAANTAIDLGRLGATTSLCCKIGNDAFGAFVLSQLRKNNVNTEPVVVEEGVGTSVSIVNVNSEGERNFLHNPGSTAYLRPEDMEDKLLEEHDIVFIGSAMLLPRFDGKPAADFLKKAQEMGKYTVLDTVWDFEDIWFPKIREELQYLDLFMPSIEEAIKLTNKDDVDEIVDEFFALGAKNVIIKVGKQGAYICEKGKERYYAKPYFQKNPVDTNGAGDSFCAGFLCGLAKGWAYERCAMFANAVGSHCIMEKGAYNGVVHMDKIQAFMIEKEREDEHEN